MMSIRTLFKPVGALGDFTAMSLDTLMAIPRRPFAWRELLVQSWFVARVSLLPTVMLAIPFTVLLVFTFNVLFVEFGAADLSGAGAAFGTVTQIGPIVTVLVVAGAGATAMCADLGARTIRDELDALRVMGINPIQSLVVPRVLAAMFVASMLSSAVVLVGLAGAFAFSVFAQNVTPGAFVASLTLVTGLSDVVIGLLKSALFGLAAGLIACYKGMPNLNTKQDYRGALLDFNLNLNLPPACETGYLPAQQIRSTALQDYPDLPAGNLYCRVPQDSTLVAVRGARNTPCANDPNKRAPTAKMCESAETYVPLNDGTNWKGDPNATLSGQGIPQLPPGQPPAPAAAALPALTVTPYDPATGTYVGPDGKTYTQTDLATNPQEQTWQSMLMPPNPR